MAASKYKGMIQGGVIVVPEPVDLPEGTEVEIYLEPIVQRTPPTKEEMEEFASLPFFGMWADREDLKDSVEWVNQQRARWRERLTRRD